MQSLYIAKHYLLYFTNLDLKLEVNLPIYKLKLVGIKLEIRSSQ